MGTVGGSRFGSTPRRHPASAGLWRCPTCGTENPGTIDDGCQNLDCPTRAHRPQPAAPAAERDVLGEQPLHPATATDEDVAWAAWAMDAKELTLRDAFAAGWAAREVRGGGQGGGGAAGAVADPPKQSPASTEPKILILVDAEEVRDGLFDGPAEPISAPALATILAALDFYAANALVYGPHPGQLHESEVRRLIALLTPPEESL